MIGFRDELRKKMEDAEFKKFFNEEESLATLAIETAKTLEHD